jgi:CheY-like chemotaxis protein
MADQAQTSAPQQTLMLVDDDAFLLNIYANRFSKGGYAVMPFSDPLAGLEKIKTGFEPDILLLDVLMPSMNGIEFLKNVREGKLIPATTTVVILTNQSDSAEMEAAKALGIDGYIVKATSIPSEVVETVAALAAKHQSK